MVVLAEESLTGSSFLHVDGKWASGFRYSASAETDSHGQLLRLRASTDLVLALVDNEIIPLEDTPKSRSSAMQPDSESSLGVPTS